MTADQATEFVRLMLLESLIGGLLGAIAWDAIKSGSVACISGVAGLLTRRASKLPVLDCIPQT